MKKTRKSLMLCTQNGDQTGISFVCNFTVFTDNISYVIIT